MSKRLQKQFENSFENLGRGVKGISDKKLVNQVAINERNMKLDKMLDALEDIQSKCLRPGSSKRTREVIDRIYNPNEGISYSENMKKIAKDFEVSPSRIYSIHRRALWTLRHLLNNHPEFSDYFKDYSFGEEK